MRFAPSCFCFGSKGLVGFPLINAACAHTHTSSPSPLLAPSFRLCHPFSRDSRRSTIIYFPSPPHRHSLTSPHCSRRVPGRQTPRRNRLSKILHPSLTRFPSSILFRRPPSLGATGPFQKATRLETELGDEVCQKLLASS